MPPINFYEILKETDENTKLQFKNQFAIPSHIVKNEPDNPLSNGHKIVDAVRRAWTIIDKERQRTNKQQYVCEIILSCVAPFIYGEAMDKFEREIKKRNRWDDINVGLCLQAPRRAGKSEAAAMATAALISAIPNFTAICISNAPTSANEETGMLGKVKKYLAILKIKCKIKDKKYLYINYSDTDIRSLTSLSDKVGNG